MGFRRNRRIMIIVDRKRHEHPMYTRWRSMKSRCFDKKHKAYPRYGGKGIIVCDRWMDFWNYVEDMGLPPTPVHTIDRIDSSGNYCKENCRWLTPFEQARNRVTNIWVEHDGHRLTLMDWSIKNGVPYRIYQSRIRNGWDPVDAITFPLQHGKKYERSEK